VQQSLEKVGGGYLEAEAGACTSATCCYPPFMKFEKFYERGEGVPVPVPEGNTWRPPPVSFLPSTYPYPSTYLCLLLPEEYLSPAQYPPVF
jgi:hypothetical protein